MGLAVMNTLRDYNVHIYIYPSWQWNHIGKQYLTIASSNVRTEKEFWCSKQSITKGPATIENTNDDNWRDVVPKVKLIKARSNAVSLILIVFQQIEIKISTFHRFVARQSMVLAHSSKFRIHSIFMGRHSLLSRWLWITTYSRTKYQQFYMGGCADKAAFKRYQPEPDR